MLSQQTDSSTRLPKTADEMPSSEIFNTTFFKGKLELCPAFKRRFSHSSKGHLTYMASDIPFPTLGGEVHQVWDLVYVSGTFWVPLGVEYLHQRFSQPIPELLPSFRRRTSQILLKKLGPSHLLYWLSSKFSVSVHFSYFVVWRFPCSLLWAQILLAWFFLHSCWRVWTTFNIISATIFLAFVL